MELEKSQIPVSTPARGSLKYDKLEIGCGGRPTPGYLHQDVTRVEEAELDFICSPWEIPVPDESLSEVIALGSVEHHRFVEVEKTFRHIYRKLKPGGSFLFDVPDMKVWALYLYQMTHGMQEKNPFTEEHIWSTVYGWQRWPGDEHKSGFTRESILQLVKKCGFDKVEEGVQVFKRKGIERRRFNRPEDGHIYLEITK